MFNAIWKDIVSSGLLDRALIPVCIVIVVAILRGFIYKSGDKTIQVGGLDRYKNDDKSQS